MEIEEVQPMNKNEIFKLIIDIILVILILALIGIFIYFIIIFKKDAFQCLQNPVLYYEQLKNASCSCLDSNLFFPTP